MKLVQPGLLMVAALTGLVFLLPAVQPRDSVPWLTAQHEAPGTFVRTGSYTTHYVPRGVGDPVILIHGFMYHSVMWDGTQEALAPDFRTYAIDLLGWGYSSRLSQGNYSYDLYAHQVVQFMDAMGIESASLVGQSMGGGTAILVAARWPERIRKLVLVDAAGLPNPLPLTAGIFGLPRVGEFLVSLPGRVVFQKNLRDFWFHDSRFVTDEYVDAVIRPLQIRGSGRSILNILRTMDFGSLEKEVDRLAAYEKPALIIWGKQDRAVPLEIGRTLHAKMPRAKFMEVDRAGHSPHEERPDVVNPAIREFLHRDLHSAE